MHISLKEVRKCKSYFALQILITRMRNEMKGKIVRIFGKEGNYRIVDVESREKIISEIETKEQAEKLIKDFNLKLE